MSDSKNNLAWKELFEKHRIIENILKKGFFIITSTEINNIGFRFDFSKKIFYNFKLDRLGFGTG